MSLLSYFIVPFFQVANESSNFSEDLKNCPKSCIVQKEEELEFDEYGNPLYEDSILQKAC
jgi:hypothetical protein